MRSLLISSFVLMVALGLLAACNSTEQALSKQAKSSAQSPKSPTQSPAQPPAATDSARRITPEELHKLWEKNDVLVVDTRNEPSFKQSHIKGAILIPANEFASRSGELPRDKMIVAYCT